MAANFNVVNLFDISPPAGAFVTESSRERSVDLVKIRGQSANVECMFPKKYGKMTATIRGTGTLLIGALAAGTMEPGTMLVTSRRRSEFQDDARTFEISASGYYNRAA